MRSARLFRVFVSSTFSDFEPERNALHARVFPRLERLCAERGHQFQPIDLRWGISEEAAQDQQTLRICLGEIARCQAATRRPNLLILLGDRYGWQPLPIEIPDGEWSVLTAAADDADRALLRAWYRRDDNRVPAVHALQPRHGAEADHEVWTRIEARLRTILRRASLAAPLDAVAALKYRASATEQEIHQGALASSDAASRAICFARTIHDLPDDARARRVTDVSGGGRDADAAARVRDLRDRLRVSLGPAFHAYDAQWTGDGVSDAHLGEFCERVFTALADAMLAEIGSTAAIDAEVHEHAAHEAFLADRAAGFVGRGDALASIEAYLSGEAASLMAVIGASGVGKSALMARACQQARVRWPQAVVVPRFIGVTADASTARGLVAGLCRHVAGAYGAEQRPLPADFHELAGVFRTRLELARADRPLVLMLDALDQLADVDRGDTLAWLPTALPPHVRLIVSSVPALEPVLGPLAGEGQCIELRPLSSDEGDALLQTWLTAASATLQPHQRRVILDGFARNGLPLYLRLAFEASRRWRSYDEPEALGSDVPAIVDQLFARLSSPAQHGPLLVERSLGYLASGRSGLTESELVDVLSRDDEVFDDFLAGAHHTPPARRLPAIVWSRLHLDLAPYLTERRADGTTVIAFFHRQLAEGVRERFLAHGRARGRHAALAAYFGDRAATAEAADVRALAELPYQQAHADDWPALARTLSHCGFMERKASAVGPQDLIDDYDLTHVFGASAPAAEARELALVQSALRLSARALTVEPGVMRSDLHGRLERQSTPLVATLLARIRDDGRAWLQLTTRTIAAPGSALIRSFSGDEGITALALTRDGRFAVSHAFGALRLWDLEQGTLVRTLAEQEPSPLWLRLRDDRSLLVASPEAGVRTIDVTSGASRGCVDPQSAASAAAISIGGRCAAFLAGGQVTVWDVARGVESHTVNVDEPAFSVAVSDDGAYVAIDDGAAGLSIYASANGALQGRFRHAETRLVALELPGATTAALAFTSYAPALLDWSTGSYSRPLHPCPDQMFATAGWDMDRRRAAVISRATDDVQVWDAAGESVHVLGKHSHGDFMQHVALAVSPDGTRALTAAEAGEMRCWDLDGEPEPGAAHGHARVVRLLAIDAARTHVVSAANDGIRLWSLADGALVRALDNVGYVSHLALLPESGHVVTVLGDYTSLVTWDPATGNEIARRPVEGALQQELSQIQYWESRRACFLMDGRVLVAAPGGPSLAIVDVASGELAGRLASRSERPSAVAGNRVQFAAIGSSGGDLWLETWDASSLAKRYEGRLPPLGIVRTLALTAEPSLVLVATAREGVQIWDCASSRFVGALMGSTPGATAVSGDGRVVAVTGEVLRLWSLPSGRLLTAFGGDTALSAVALADDTVACGDTSGRVHVLRIR